MTREQKKVYWCFATPHFQALTMYLWHTDNVYKIEILLYCTVYKSRHPRYGTIWSDTSAATYIISVRVTGRHTGTYGNGIVFFK
jgi:hypothetical protein